MVSVLLMNNTKTHPEWVQVLYSKAILMSEILEDDEPELFFWTGVWHHPRTAKPSLVCSRTGVWSHLLPASRITRWVLCTPGKPLPCTNFPASQMIQMFRPCLLHFFSQICVRFFGHPISPSLSLPQTPILVFTASCPAAQSPHRRPNLLLLCQFPLCLPQAS